MADPARYDGETLADPIDGIDVRRRQGQAVRQRRRYDRRQQLRPWRPDLPAAAFGWPARGRRSRRQAGKARQALHQGHARRRYERRRGRSAPRAGPRSHRHRQAAAQGRPEAAQRPRPRGAGRREGRADRRHRPSRDQTRAAARRGAVAGRDGNRGCSAQAEAAHDRSRMSWARWCGSRSSGARSARADSANGGGRRARATCSPRRPPAR